MINYRTRTAVQKTPKLKRRKIDESNLADSSAEEEPTTRILAQVPLPLHEPEDLPATLPDSCSRYRTVPGSMAKLST